MGQGSLQKYFPANLSYRNFVYIPLFFSFYIVYRTFEKSTYWLKSFLDRSISVATSEGIDIGQRVALFYRGIFFTAILFILLMRVVIIVRRYFNEQELIILNGLSLAGFCLLLFQLLGANMVPSLNFIFSMMFICLSGFVYHQVKKRDEIDYKTPFVWSVLVATCLFFFQWQVFQFVLGKTVFSLPLIVTIAGSGLYLFVTNNKILSFRMIAMSRPLIFLPLLTFLSIELYLIFNQRGFYISPKIIYAIGIALILFRSYTSSKKNVASLSRPLIDVFFSSWIPWILLGMTCFAFHTPVIKPEIDFFESANSILPLQQLFSFGKIPFLDIFSSHTLSDFGFGLVYSIFNGADPMGVFVYRFLLGVVIILVIYHFIYKISGDGFLALWIAIAYPYTELLLPSYFNIIPLAALAFIMVFRNQTVKNYVIFFCTLIFMVVWRIDLGMSTIIAGFLSLFVLFFISGLEFKNLLKGLAISASVVLLFFLLSLMHSGSNIWIAMKDAVNYLSSYQSYGVKDLSPVIDIKYYSLYFILPAVIMIIVFYSFFGLFRKKFNGNNIYCALSIIFLGFFYFSNFQRGLVRHTLYEHWNAALTSYGFLIITLFVYMTLRNSSQNFRFLVFFIVATLLTSNYVFTEPDLKTNNSYSYISAKIFESQIVPQHEKVKRIIEDDDIKNNSAEFASFVKKYILGKSTFLDFSNTPMLYYYSDKLLPSYLVQIPHTAHNDYLQKRLIKDLKKYDLPYVVFSNVPNNYWDNLDGIPNTLRHYRISEYIYRNYKPGAIVNKHSIWYRKNMFIPNTDSSFTINQSDLRPIRGIQNNNGTFVVSNERGNLDYWFPHPISFEGKKVFATIKLTSNQNSDLKFFYASSKGIMDVNLKSEFTIRKGENNFFINIDPANGDINYVQLETGPGINFSISEFKIYSGNETIDYFSSMPVDYRLRWIPFIWGTYDKDYLDKKIPLEKNIYSGAKLLSSNTENRFEFSPVTDREKGNYIKLTCRLLSKEDGEMNLTYGIGENYSGSFSFTLAGDSLMHDYLVRISSQYNWYSRENNSLRLSSNGTVDLQSLDILKGD